MKITILVEGKTETAFKTFLTEFLKGRLSDRMPSLDFFPYHGRIPTKEALKRKIKNTLYHDKNPADHVIALTDVYTGSQHPEFLDAADAKRKMRQWVGVEPRFHPHAAQHDFEAWLLPYWPKIQKLAGHNKTAPSRNPEKVNHGNPPAYRIIEIFRIGTCNHGYVKTRDAAAILRGNDLLVAINQCPELKAFINTILHLSGGELIL
jgi:hypothetical protein